MAPPPRLLVITPPRPDPARLSTVLPNLWGIVDAVLLRWPTTSAGEVLALAQEAAAAHPRPALLVSDRVDVALAAGVEGVHLQDGGLPPARVRPLGLVMVGVSCHPAQNPRVPPGADFVLASPVFTTASKPASGALGLAALGRFCHGTQTAVLALGGVDATRVVSCRQAGAYGVAVLSAVWSAPDPVDACRALRRALARS